MKRPNDFWLVGGPEYFEFQEPIRVRDRASTKLESLLCAMAAFAMPARDQFAREGGNLFRGVTVRRGEGFYGSVTSLFVDGYTPNAPRGTMLRVGRSVVSMFHSEFMGLTLVDAISTESQRTVLGLARVRNLHDQYALGLIVDQALLPEEVAPIYEEEAPQQAVVTV